MIKKMRSIKSLRMTHVFFYLGVVLGAFVLCGCVAPKPSGPTTQEVFAIQHTEKHGGVNYVYSEKK